MAVLRRPVRSRPIRVFLISMFAIPLVSLVGLWVFAVSVTVPEAVSDHNLNVSTAASDTQGRALAVGLPTERAQTYLWLLSGRRAPEASLLATREAVNKAIPPAVAAMRTQDGLLSAGPQAELNAFFTDLGQIGHIRAAVDSGSLSPTAAFQAYSNIIDTQLHSFEASDQDNKGGSLAGTSVGAVEADYALEMASQEVTLVDGALADRDQMSAGARQLFNTAVASRRVYLNEATALLPPSLEAGLATIAGSPNYQQFQAMEDQITASTGNGPLPGSELAAGSRGHCDEDTHKGIAPATRREGSRKRGAPHSPGRQAYVGTCRRRGAKSARQLSRLNACGLSPR